MSDLEHLKIAIAHPLLRRGGSEAAVMWAVESLKSRAKVSLITCGDVDIAALNDFYGTCLAPDEFDLRRPPLTFLLGKTRRLAVIRHALHARFCRQLAINFDILISGYNVIDFGVPAIHIIADPSWTDVLRRRYDPLPPGWWSFVYGDNLVRNFYLRLARVLSRPSGRNPFAGHDLLLANSSWTAGVIQKHFGATSRILFPPVVGQFPNIPLGQKENGFVFIGRISPEKRIEKIIDILRRVRHCGHDIHLHVIGHIGEDVYGKRIRRLCVENREWVYIEGQKSGAAKRRLLSGHRFGINARRNEPFGIAVAELVKAGAIVFVPLEGGQAEIVNHPTLTWQSVEEAVAKIAAVLRHEATQSKLSRHLNAQAKRFGTGQFCDGICEAVKEFVQGQ